MAINRVTGFSGFDVEGTVKKLMDAEGLKLTKVKQNRQMQVWKQEAYRSVIDKLNTFKSDYFDILKPDSNLRSATMFSKFTSAVTSGGTANTAVTVTGTADMQSLTQQIDSIDQLAQKEIYRGTSVGFETIKTADLDFGAAKPAVFKTSLTIGSSTKTIEVDMSAVTNATEFAAALNSKISDASAFGAAFNNVVSVNGNGVKFSSPGNSISMLEQTGFTTSLPWAGLTTGVNTNQYKTKSIETLLGIDSAKLSSMTINGTSLASMGVATTDTLSQMMQKINAGNYAGTISYDAVSDSFKMSANKEGVANKLTLSADFQSKFSLSNPIASETAKDAKLTINGIAVVKSENSFVLNGAQYKLNSTHTTGTPIDVKFSVNSTAITDKIKGFIESYNSIVSMTYSKTSEKLYRDFKPLSDEQKKEMTEDQVKIWEEKAKSGLLRNNSEIENVARRMRQALQDTVEGAGLTLAQIGIETSSDYKEKGKLIIKDETKLKTAIETNYSSVVKLFTSESDKTYSDTANASERYSENGLGNRIYDILQDAVRVTREGRDRKGDLIEIAGIKNDTSEATSEISLKIIDYDKRVATLIDYLSEKENLYYSKFSRLESALAKLNNQGSSFINQMGGK